MSEHTIVPLRIYYAVFGALLVLTATTVGIAFLDLGPLNTIAALTIAVIKATLVILYFMHVRWANRLTWVFIGAGVFWLAILLAFLFGDIWSRGWLPPSAGWTRIM